MDSDISQVGAQSIVFARAVQEKFIEKCAAMVKRMWSVTFFQKNASKGVENKLMELEELLDHIPFYNPIWTAA